ncbi:MAG: tRNA (adenosine(37)-N6)-threonylcarbamoyltransferase complex transferase subunit TsaD, partial [Candidatus Aureabacteria bacterium]|nr:tRNA (adenosine(37)-N6)-threonylcarbamoyltransferase complex transferase subunit TsaD [Candidatus Auribacterota bacterium]
LVGKVLVDAGIERGAIDLVAVTRGPGLAGCLLAGVSFAKGLAYGLGIPVVGINHIEAHIFSCAFAGEIGYPAVALVVSGGHTLLALVDGVGRYRLLGQTVDDAVGEAYDKVASMMGLPFPGGPAIEARALHAAGAERFPRPLIDSADLSFSFSGLKTAVLYRLKARGGAPLSDTEVGRISRGFQEAVVEVVVRKAMDAAEETGARCLLLAGGVAQNRALRAALGAEAEAHGRALIAAPTRYCADNGVMVAALAARKYDGGDGDGLSFDIAPGLRLC